MSTLTGKISSKKLVADISSKTSLSGTTQARLQVSGNINLNAGSVLPPVYDGEVTITPSATEDLCLDTSDKMLLTDITVQKIPYAEVSNSSNGTTVTIA